MKRIITAATVLCAALAAFTGCNDQVEPMLYNGPEYVMFPDTLQEYYVSEKKSTVTVAVSATTAVDYDRTISIDVVGNGSTAIEDHHFTLKEHNVIIKAGKLAANVELNVNTAAFGDADSLGTTLRLIIPQTSHWDLYGIQTKVSLQKYCDLDMNGWLENEKAAINPEKYNYANYILHATFPFSDSDSQFTKVLVKVMKGREDENQLIIKSPFQSNVDLKISLIDGDPSESGVKILSQKVFFGLNTLWVHMQSNDLYPSNYDSCKRYMELQIESYMDQYGTFGIYPYYLEWITEARAEDIRNTGF